MASIYRRTSLRSFALANPFYVGASVTVYVIDTTNFQIKVDPVTGQRVKAALYDAPTGTGFQTNPIQLDGEGKYPRPTYFEDIVTEVVVSTTGTTETGVTFPGLSDDEVQIAVDAAAAAVVSQQAAHNAEVLAQAAQAAAAASAAQAASAVPLDVPLVLGAIGTLYLNHLTVPTLDSRLTFARASTGNYTDKFGQAQVANVNIPRFDYGGAAPGAPLGLLVYPTTGPLSAETASMPVDNTVLLSAEGSLLVEFDVAAIGGGTQTLAEISDGTLNNRWTLAIIAGVLTARLIAAGVPVDIALGAVTTGVVHRAMLAWGAFGLRAVLDNGAVSTLPSGAQPGGTTTLFVGCSSAGNQLGGHVRRVAIFPRAPDATTMGLLTDLVRALDLYDLSGIGVQFAALVAQINATLASASPAFDPGTRFGGRY